MTGPDEGSFRIKCESDAWPFAVDVGVFEVRRAIGQLARSVGRAWEKAHPNSSSPLLYLASAKFLQQALQRVTSDLVAEARARGTTWEEIGKAFGIGGKAAQKRFSEGIDDERRDRLGLERAVVRQSNEANESTSQIPDDLKEELAGTSPEERIRYALDLIFSTEKAFEAAYSALGRSDPDNDEVFEHIVTAKNRLILLFQIVVADRAQWQAVARWAEQASYADAANYHAPATYWYLVMRQIWLATLQTLSVFAPDVDAEQSIRFFLSARLTIKQVILVLLRDDIQFPPIAEPVPETHEHFIDTDDDRDDFDTDGNASALELLPVTDTVRRAMTEAGTLYQAGTPIGTYHVLAALMRADASTGWDRIGLHTRDAAAIRATDAVDPHRQPAGRWNGAILTATLVRAIRLAARITVEYGFDSIPVGALVLGLIADPDAGAARALGVGDSVDHEFLVTLVQAELLGGQLEDLEL